MSVTINLNTLDKGPRETLPPVYRKNKKNSPELNSKLLSTLKQNDWRDRYDDPLYDEIVMIFTERCLLYNITVPSMWLHGRNAI